MNPTLQVKAPTEERLRLMVASGPETREVAQSFIDKFKMPYLIVRKGDDYELRSSYSRGELFLQKFITVDQETKQMKEDALKMSAADYPVLVCGETGTGKELIAKSMIGKREGAIKSVNCAGLPEGLVESLLFGYVQGAFTGAVRTTDGLMTAAENGLIFLDEIGFMSLEAQTKLLRAIQEKKITKVGATRDESINCRIVAATNKDLQQMVKDGKFLIDLYARISTLELFIKPLRDRRCDIVPITESLEGGHEFLSKYREELETGVLDMSLNVRSIEKYVARYKVLGRIK